MSYSSNKLLQVEVNGKKKQVYYDMNDTKLPVFMDENGGLFCKLSGGSIVNVNSYPKAIIEVDGETIEIDRNNKLYTVENFITNNFTEICDLDIRSLEKQNFYKTDASTNFSEKINGFQIQDEKVVANTQQITVPTNTQLHDQGTSMPSRELNENREVIINEQVEDILIEKLTNKYIKQMKKEVKQLQKQYKQQQKTKQKMAKYSQIQESEEVAEETTEVEQAEETTEVEQAEETKAMKLLKQIYNTNYKDSQKGMGNHISYNDEESIGNNKYVFEITNEENKTEKIYFNKKSKIKELDNLMSACEDLIIQRIFRSNEHGLIL